MKAIADAPPPKDLTSLKAYLGLLNFYGSFIRDLSAKIQPLYEMTKKNKQFVWTTKSQKAFEISKFLLLDSPMLTIYDPKLPIGVKFFSSTLTDAEKKYSQLEREALAIVFMMKKYHKYLYGRKFTIFSDHNLLQFIFGEKKLNSATGARVQRWSLFLSQYDYNIEYRKASRMGNADALSRLPIQSKTNISEVGINHSISGDIPLTGGP